MGGYDAIFFFSSFVWLIGNAFLTEKTQMLIKNNENFELLISFQIFVEYCSSYLFAWLFMIYIEKLYDAVKKYFRPNTCWLVMIGACIVYSGLYVAVVFAQNTVLNLKS